MSIIQVKRMWKEYGSTVVLENVNLEIAEGTFCTIVGASGCGKTTFLRMILGQETPSRGQILLNGQPLPSEPGADRGIVFQRYSVFPHLSVVENVMLGLELAESKFWSRLWGQKRRQAHDAAMEMLQAVGLESSKDKYPSALSGGMQQRLALAQALIMKPKILLLDEPFGALDPGIRADMHQLVLKLWQDIKLTILMITHDLKEGFFLGTRLLVFDKTRVDTQVPEGFGASITYDLPLKNSALNIPEEIRQKYSQSQEQ